jgi:hypothetical protein
MEKVIVTEEQVKEVLNNILSEQMKRVSRQDFNRTQFKIEELQNSLNETLKEYGKLKSSIPQGLQTPTRSRIQSIGDHLYGVQLDLNKLKVGVFNYKKKTYSQQPPKDSGV